MGKFRIEVISEAKEDISKHLKSGNQSVIKNAKVLEELDKTSFEVVGEPNPFVLVPLKNKEEECLLTDAQKKAIDEALDGVANGRVNTHQYVMEETKKRFPHLFKR
jgi:hypothetical protein